LAVVLTLSIGLLLAYANGANDNFKGVATLFGSASASYRRALLWATATTALGSVTAVVLARGLLESFSGRGLTPDEAVAHPSFALAVALGAGSTVLLATRFGLPISTTHALVGGLVGAGLLHSAGGINLVHLGDQFLLPLLTSPLIAAALSVVAYRGLRRLRIALGVEEETCVCVDDEIVGVAAGTAGFARTLRAVNLPTVTVGSQAVCRAQHRGEIAGFSARPLLDGAHYVSAGVVSFARGLNDTPKIAALLIVGDAISATNAVAGVTLAIAAGGLLSARRVAETMSRRVTAMNSGQGFAANMVTGLLVVGASFLGLPVSTTHVSCGSLFGIGAATGQGHWEMIRRILAAWVVTFPMAALFGALCMACLDGYRYQ